MSLETSCQHAARQISTLYHLFFTSFVALTFGWQHASIQHRAIAMVRCVDGDKPLDKSPQIRSFQEEIDDELPEIFVVRIAMCEDEGDAIRVRIEYGVIMYGQSQRPGEVSATGRLAILGYTGWHNESSPDVEFGADFGHFDRDVRQ